LEPSAATRSARKDFGPAGIFIAENKEEVVPAAIG
jgi:hypothetical protein